MSAQDRRPRIVILDRDGVINEDSPHYIKHPDEWLPIPGSLEAIALLHANGFKVYVATNQAGIARGNLDEPALHAIHQKMSAAVSKAGGAISGIYYCPHHPDDHCSCRKPAPGMLLKIAADTKTNIEGVAYVGDSLKDIRAAEAAGCRAALVLTGNGNETHKLRPNMTLVFTDLLAFAENEISI